MDPATMASFAQMQQMALAQAANPSLASQAQVTSPMMDPTLLYQQMLMQAQQAQLAQMTAAASQPDMAAQQASTLALAQQVGLAAAQAAAKASVSDGQSQTQYQPQAQSLAQAQIAAMLTGAGGCAARPAMATQRAPAAEEERPAKRLRPDWAQNMEGKPWICACGFQNRASNLMCGGFGDKNLGCKKPRQDVDVTSAEKPWLCACGFQNRPTNKVCGGYGNKMGCGEARREKDGVALPPTDDWVCECKFVNRQRNLICGGNGEGLGCKKPKPGVIPGITSTDDGWVCDCGFQNSLGNKACGGVKGDRGCGKPRMTGVWEEPSIFKGKGSLVGAADVSQDWQCLFCGFQNFAKNNVCGGDKPGMGCKMQRSGEEKIGAEVWEGSGTSKSKGKGKPSTLGDAPLQDWDCIHCGFNNFAKNTICGGERSALGCKAPRAIADSVAVSSLLMGLASKGKGKGKGKGSSLPSSASFSAGKGSAGFGKLGKGKLF